MKTLHVRLKNIAVGIFDGPHATPKEAASGYIYLGIKNITQQGRLDLSEINYISEQEFPKWIKRVLPQKDDIVFTYEATLHRYAIIPANFEGCLGRRLGLVRPNTNMVSPKFLHYYFLSPIWRGYTETKVIVGATVNRLPVKDIPNFTIDIPESIKIQQKIADILSAYDDLIENNRRRIQLLEESARQLYKEWFVRLRFPGHEHVRVVDGVPEGWENKKASELIAINPKTTIDTSKQVKYFPMSALSTDGMTISLDEIEHRDKPTNVHFGYADTLFARITPCLENGKTAICLWLKESEVACGSTEFIILRGRTVSPWFTYIVARQEEMRALAVASMIGASGRQRVHLSCFDKFFIAMPPKKLLDNFDDIAQPIFIQIQNLVLQNHKLAQARDLLLPKLMSGEVAV